MAQRFHGSEAYGCRGHDTLSLPLSSVARCNHGQDEHCPPDTENAWLELELVKKPER
jgi:hypothetical protein